MIEENIRTFLEVCRTQSMSGAAQSLFLTQSTVSRQVRELEKELGVRLFERGKGQAAVLLTPAAERLLPIARQMRDLEEKALAIRKEGVSAHFAMAAPESLANYRLAPFFKEMCTRHRDWDLSLSVQDSSPICHMILEGSLDAGIINAQEISSRLEAREIFSEPFVIVRRQPQAGRMVKEEELDPYHEVFYECGASFNAWHDRRWDPWQAKLKVNLAAMAVQCLDTPGDWTMLPASVAQRLAPDPACIQELTENAPHRTAYYIVRKGLETGRQERAGQVLAELTDFLHTL